LIVGDKSAWRSGSHNDAPRPVANWRAKKMVRLSE
jgi:hypothetical protein